MNIMFKSLITWPAQPKMEDVMLEFKELCGLPSVHGTIDNTHISIYKPKFDFVKDYYFHKTKGYQVIKLVYLEMCMIPKFCKNQVCTCKLNIGDCSTWTCKVKMVSVLTFLVTKGVRCYHG